MPGVMQYRTHKHTGRNHNSDGDSDPRDKGAVRVLQRGSRPTSGDSQERERLLEHTHTISPSHTGTQKVRYVSQHRDVFCCNLIVYVYIIRLDGWLQKRESVYSDSTIQTSLFLNTVFLIVLFDRMIVITSWWDDIGNIRYTQTFSCAKPSE